MMMQVAASGYHTYVGIEDTLCFIFVCKIFEGFAKIGLWNFGEPTEAASERQRYWVLMAIKWASQRNVNPWRWWGKEQRYFPHVYEMFMGPAGMLNTWSSQEE